MDNVQRFGNRLVIYPKADEKLQTLVDLRVFNGFQPRITFEEAKKRFGEPDTKGVGPYGPYWMYKTSGGKVSVSHEEQGSPPFPYTKWWILRGYPDDSSVDKVFHPAVREHIASDAKDLEVSVMSSDYGPVLTAKIKAGQVDSMTWLRIK